MYAALDARNERYIVFLITVLMLSALLVMPKTVVANDVGYPVSEYRKLEIYYHFGYQSLHKLSLERARKISGTRITSTDDRYITGFVEWLDLAKMQPAKNVDVEETSAFIVIDLYRISDGKKETLFSDGDYLYSLNPAMKRPVDVEFRSKFHFFEDLDPVGITGH